MDNSNTTNLPIPQDDDILAFIIAIKSGSIDKMKQMLNQYRGNISNKLQSQLRQPPLYFAVINADQQLGFQMAKALIQNGANAQFKDANQQTVIFYCCRDGKRKLAEFLINLGVKLNQQDLYGQTPLYYAASQNRLNLLDLFTPQMVNHVDKLAKQTPLYYAARKGHLDMCKALIEKGADVNHLDSSNKSAIEYAKKAKCTEVVDYLTLQAKRIKQINKNQLLSNNMQDSSQNQITKKKKKQNSSLNMNKNNYKISLMKQNGQIHDLTEEQVKQLLKTNQQLQGYLTNPQTIPQQLLQSTLQQNWQKLANKIILILWKLKNAHWFHQPVDPIKFGILDYFDIVTKPMDLGTIKKKLNYNVYNNAKEFYDDVKQVCKNSYLYNGQHHQISISARDMENTLEEQSKVLGLTKYIN